MMDVHKSAAVFRSEDNEKDLNAESLSLLLQMNEAVILSVFSTKLRDEKLEGWKKRGGTEVREQGNVHEQILVFTCLTTSKMENKLDKIKVDNHVTLLAHLCYC